MTWVMEAECNVCRARKRDVNGWWEVHTAPSLGTIQFRAMRGQPGDPGEHLCGNKCLHTRLDQWTAQTSTPPAEGAESHGNSNQS